MWPITIILNIIKNDNNMNIRKIKKINNCNNFNKNNLIRKTTTTKIIGDPNKLY